MTDRQPPATPPDNTPKTRRPPDDPPRKKITPNRQRHADLHIRLLPAEKAKATALADRAGLALGAFARAAMLGDAGPRAQRRTPADAALLRQVLALHNKYGSNMNQIAKTLNASNRPVPHGLGEALKEWREIRDAINLALGKTPPTPRR